MRSAVVVAIRVSCVVSMFAFGGLLSAQDRVAISAPVVREAVTPNQLTTDLRQLTQLAPVQVWNVGNAVRVIGDLREDNQPAPPQPPPAGTPPVGPAAVEETIQPDMTTRDLRDVPRTEEWRPGDPVRVMPDMREVAPPPTNGMGMQPADMQATAELALAPATLAPSAIRGAGFDGIPATGSLPPDTNGDVGPNHYIQIVNTSFAIYNKTGALLAGPLAINSLWSTFGGPCQTNNNGDPVVRYDGLANRWVISQFALPAGTKFECVAVSRTADPVSGGWFLYAFPMVVAGTAVFPDYPKLGVWPDGYYMGTQRGFPSSGLDVWAFERPKMLAGAPAKQVQFAVSGTSLFLLPSDVDGPAPPAGAPNYFVRQVDGARFGGVDRIDIFAFHVDWVTTASSTFTQLPSLPVAAFDSVLCTTDLLAACIPQPGTAQKLESLTVWTMFRAQYRNFGTRETIVTNHTVDANGSDLAGVRWYELRRSGGAWSVFQQGTYAPDATNRWMGSAAMDRAGDIAVGYSVSSSAVFPGIRAAMRSPGDPPGTLAGELSLVVGGGSQTHSAARWGNYSSMDVDPVNDCTFWYTTEYFSTTSAAGWRTRIESFTMPSCSGGVAGSFLITNEPIANFATWSASSNVKRLTGDFNHDGRTDIALTGVTGWGSLPVAFSNGNGTFNVTNSATPSFPTWTTAPNAKVLVGDFNGDGRADLAVTGPAGWGSMPVAFSNGNGSFNVTNMPIVNFALWTSSPNAKVLVGDYNADGKSDVAVTGVTGWGSVPVAFSNGNGSFNVANMPIINFASWAATANVKAVVGDFNGDGRSDLALSGASGWGSLPVAMSNGNGSFSVTNLPIANFATWAATPNANLIVGRFNADNRADIAITGPSGWASLPVAFSNGNGSFNVTNAPIANFASWAASWGAKPFGGTFDSGGLMDIALSGGAGWGTLPVAFSTGTGTFNVTNQPVGAFATWAQTASVVILTGDFDGNGKTDLALTGPYSWGSLPVAFSTSP
jgi:hypothetical protein